MIGSLRGRVIEKGPTWLLLEVGGVGYRVLVSPGVLAQISGDGETFMYIHDHVREDSRDLYGFFTLQDLSLFERLIGISGIGPKVGATILSIGSADRVRDGIMRGDIDVLTSVPGVGKKTAQKIVLELKGQLVEEAQDGTGDHEVIEALKSLGYPVQEAREALKHVSIELTDTSDRIREALKNLSK